MVFDLVNAAGALAGGLAATEEGGEVERGERLLDSARDEEKRSLSGMAQAMHDVQLLRVRTRKGEAVVVPGTPTTAFAPLSRTVLACVCRTRDGCLHD